VQEQIELRDILFENVYSVMKLTPGQSQLQFIDENYQRRGIGKAALNLALEKLEEYPNAEQSPIYLQCHKENIIALTLYESFGFQPIHGVTIDDNFVLIRFPGR